MGFRLHNPVPWLKKTTISVIKNPKLLAVSLFGLFIAFLASIFIGNRIYTYFSSTGADPIVYWKLDEGTSSTVNDFIGSNDGAFGTGNSAPSWYSEDQCISGKCLRFDGTDDYINVPYSASLDLNDEFTISVWAKRTGGLAVMRSIIAQRPTSGTAHDPISLYYNTNNKLIFWMYDGSLFRSVEGTTAITDTNWHHIVFTRDASVARIYIDGKQDISTSFSHTSSSAANEVIHIGADPYYPGGRNFNGFLDEVKIYDYARTAAQVKAEYAARGTVRGVAAQFGDDDISRKLSNGLIGYWKMDEVGVSGSSWTARDSSGSNNNGTGAGNASVGTTFPGKFGNTAYFDGTGDYITLDLSKMPIGTRPTYTWATWVYYIPSFAHQKIFAWGAASANQGVFVSIYSSGFVGIDHHNNDWQTTYSVPQGQWTHLVGTFDGNNTETLYANGVQVDQRKTVSSFTLGSSGAYIGRYITASEYMKSPLDEVRIYNRTLDPSEVKALYEYTPGPIAHWKFDDNASVIDSSGNNLSGGMNGGMSTSNSVQGKFGRALSFDGSNDYIGVSDPGTNSILDFSNRNQITISAWFNPNILPSEGNFQTIVTKGLTDSSGDDLNYGLFWGRESGSGDLVFDMCYTNTSDSYHCLVTDLSQPIVVGEWHHIAVTYTFGVSSSGKLYFNGQSVAVRWDGTGNDAPNIMNEPIWIGADSWGGSVLELMNGKIDDVRIYNYTRTPAQIVSDMNAGHPAPGSPIGSAMAHWKMDEGYGTKINNDGNVGVGLTGVFATGTSAPAWSNDGKFGKALSFDGNDYVNFGDNDLLKLTFPFTLSAWVNISELVVDEYTIISKWYSLTSDREYAFQIINDNRVRFGKSENGTNSQFIYANTAFSATDIGKWNHVMLTADESGNYTFYRNGNPDGSGTFPSTTIFNDSASAMIGAVNYSNANPSRFFKGSIDEVKIYNFGFNADQAKVEFNQGKAQVMGAGSTGIGGTGTSFSASREYCLPGDSSTCSAPVGEWKFEAIEGTTAYDTSSNGNSGTLTNGPRQVKGKTGKGLYFDGTNDYVDFGDMTSLEGVSQATWSFWIKADAWNIGQIIMGKTNVTTTDISWLMNHSSTTQGRLVITIAASASDLTRYGYINSVLTGNEWKHITIVFDGSLTGNSNRLKLYINGVQNTLTYGGTLPATLRATSTSTVLGGISGATNYSVRGIMDQVRMYNYARTPAQVAWEYNQGAPVGYFKLDEGTGTVAKNWAQSANGEFTGNNGTLGASGAAPTWTTGKYESSLFFDGTDDVVDVADPSDGSLDIAAGEDFTLMFWINPEDRAAARAVMGKKTANTAGAAGYLLHLFAAETLGLYTADGTDSNLTSGAALPVGEWTHVAIVYDDDVAATFYYDGIDSTINNGTGFSSVDSLENSTIFKLGNESDNQANFYFRGGLDDVRLYKYALTMDQILEAKNNGAVRFQ